MDDGTGGVATAQRELDDAITAVAREASLLVADAEGPFGGMMRVHEDSFADLQAALKRWSEASEAFVRAVARAQAQGKLLDPKLTYTK